jgi:hypothetical protein
MIQILDADGQQFWRLGYKIPRRKQWQLPIIFTTIIRMMTQTGRHSAKDTTNCKLIINGSAQKWPIFPWLHQKIGRFSWFGGTKSEKTMTQLSMATISLA